MGRQTNLGCVERERLKWASILVSTPGFYVPYQCLWAPFISECRLHSVLILFLFFRKCSVRHCPHPCYATTWMVGFVCHRAEIARHDMWLKKDLDQMPVRSYILKNRN